jgi:putative transposase
MGGKMVVNEAGKILRNQISDIKNHFDYVMVDEFIVMPNHVHLILVL